MTRLDRTNAVHHVYRCFDANGRLLYVGSSANLFGRLAQHRATSWWAPTVAKVNAEVYPNGIAARDVERRAIREEVPRWNKAGKWAGRHLWTQEDWNDWLTTCLRVGGFLSARESFGQYRSLFGGYPPAHITDEFHQLRTEYACRRADALRAQEEQRARFEKADRREQRKHDELATRRSKKGKSA